MIHEIRVDGTGSRVGHGTQPLIEHLKVDGQAFIGPSIPEKKDHAPDHIIEWYCHLSHICHSGYVHTIYVHTCYTLTCPLGPFLSSRLTSHWIRWPLPVHPAIVRPSAARSHLIKPPLSTTPNPLSKFAYAWEKSHGMLQARLHGR